MLDDFTASTLLPLLGPHLPTSIGSILACCVLQAATHILGPKVAGGERWKAFSGRTRTSFATRMVSHALIAVPLALYHVYHRTLSVDPVFGYDPALGDCLAISAGYFAWDTVDSILNSSTGFVIHGAACLAVYLFSYRPFMAGYGPSFLLWELSTPFLNFHWFMEKLGISVTHPKLFHLNAITFASTFFVARICYGGYSSIAFYQSVLAEWHRSPLYLTVIYCLGNLALNALNWLWFYRIVQKLLDRSQEDKTIRAAKEL